MFWSYQPVVDVAEFADVMEYITITALNFSNIKALELTQHLVWLCAIFGKFEG